MLPPKSALDRLRTASTVSGGKLKPVRRFLLALVGLDIVFGKSSIARVTHFPVIRTLMDVQIL